MLHLTVMEEKLKEGNRKKEGRWSDIEFRLGKLSVVAHKMVKAGKKTCSFRPHRDLMGLNELRCVGVWMETKKDRKDLEGHWSNSSTTKLNPVVGWWS